MFVVKNKELNINWEFKWEYRTKMGKTPDYWATIAYVHFFDRDSHDTGIIGSYAGCYFTKQGLNKDEARINMLYQALESLSKFYCNDSPDKKELLYRTVLERYADVHSVPRDNTRLGPGQLRLKQDLEAWMCKD